MSILSAIGNTPLVPMPSISSDHSAVIWENVSTSTLGGSVKDRIALAIVERAEAEGAH